MDTYDLFTNIDLPKPLKDDEVIKFLTLAQAGDLEARDKIISHNIRLVIRLINNKFSFTSFDKEDLVSIGIFGLINAVDKFDISIGYKFSTFAMKCIYNEILMYLRANEKKVITLNLNDPVTLKNDESVSLLDMIADENVVIGEDLFREELLLEVRNQVEALPPRDKEIIKLYFGFDNGRRYNSYEIAKKYGLAPSTIRRSLNRITIEIGNNLKNMNLIETVRKKKHSSIHKKIKSVYELFSMYSREQVDEMLKKLSESEKKLLFLRYGDDLDNPHTSEEWNEESAKQFNGYLRYRMKSLLSNKKRRRKPKNPSHTTEGEQELKKENKTFEQVQNVQHEVVGISILPMSEQIDRTRKVELEQSTLSENSCPTMILEEDVEVETSSKLINKPNSEDYLRLSKSMNLAKILKVLSAKETIIIFLRLGYINETYYSEEKIAEFLDIDIDDVREAIKKMLLLLKESINSCNTVAASDEQKVLIHKKN